VDSSYNAWLDKRTSDGGDDEDGDDIRLTPDRFGDTPPRLHSGEADQEIAECKNRKACGEGLFETVTIDKHAGYYGKEEDEAGEDARECTCILLQSDPVRNEHHHDGIGAIESKPLRQLKGVGYPKIGFETVANVMVAVTQPHGKEKFLPP